MFTYFVLDSVEETALSCACLAQQAEAKRESIAVGSRQRRPSSRPETSHAFFEEFSEGQWVWLTTSFNCNRDIEYRIWFN